MEEENFDLSLIASLEIDIVPHIGDHRVPDALVSRLSKILQQGSRLHEFDNDRIPRPSASPILKHSKSRSRSSDLTKVDDEVHGVGKTDIGTLVPRERFSYWCFDLLFLVCSNVTTGVYTMDPTPSRPLTIFLEKEESRRRLAALSLPALLSRSGVALVNYIADQSLRGGLPFPRFVISLSPRSALK